jgi:Alginate lyase
MKNLFILFIISFLFSKSTKAQPILFKKAGQLLSKEILIKANEDLKSKPITVTSYQSERSAGGVHDFFSEADYWWPDASNPTGPYIQKDGQTNPANFSEHRLAMIRFSQMVGNLTSAYLLTKDNKFALKAIQHCKAWFVDTATKMNPSLLYAQAIKGKVTGRGVGIIDMIQMMEVAQSVLILEKQNAIKAEDLIEIKKWFQQYLQWVTTHPYGIDEREAKNNHGTCWTMQVAVFAKLVNDKSLLNYCDNRFKTLLLPSQMDLNGSFPLELKRTKPYGYSLFNLDAMFTLAQVLSTKENNLWEFKTANGLSLKKGIEFLYPFVANKNSWTLPKDIMYWENWPVAHPFLLFGYTAYGNQDWLATWSKLEHFPTTAEVIRNLPIRNPLLWITNN